MALMKRPVVVLRNPVPLLRRQRDFHRIAIDIPNCSVHLVPMIEKDFPPADSPEWVISGTEANFAKSFARCSLYVLNHLLRQVSMLANQQMNVIRHDRTCVTCVIEACDRITDRLGHYRKLGGGEREQFVLQHSRSLIIESSNIEAGRLNLLSAMMYKAEIGKNVVTDSFRRGTAWVIGQPPTIKRPHDVVSEDDWIGGHHFIMSDSR